MQDASSEEKRGWSTTKKALVGIAAAFFVIIAIGVVFGEPVETDTPKPFLEAVRVEFQEKGFDITIPLSHWT